MKKVTLILLILAFSQKIFAQLITSKDTSLAKASIVSSLEIKGAIKTVEGLAVADSVLRVLSIGGKYNVGISLVSRSKVNGKTPPDAIVHDSITEVYQIIEGRGILVTGGSLDSPKRIPSDDPIVHLIVGPSSESKSITGGTQYDVKPGDIIIIPPHTPHGFIEIKTKKIVYTLIRIDTEKVLELKNSL
jgi:mannose-6-phosphate isomerase-like protein (cupin superfamily)